MASEANSFIISFHRCHRASAFFIQRMSWRKKLTSFEKYLTLAVKNLVTLTAVWTCEKSTAFSFPPTRRFLHFFIHMWTIQSKQMEIPFYSVIHFRSDVNWAISSDLFFTHKVNHDPSGSIHLPSSSISCSVFRLRRHPAFVTKQPIGNLPF